MCKNANKTVKVNEFEIDFEEDMSEESASELDNQISESLENDILQLQDEEIDDEIEYGHLNDVSKGVNANEIGVPTDFENNIAVEKENSGLNEDKDLIERESSSQREENIVSDNENKMHKRKKRQSKLDWEYNSNEKKRQSYMGTTNNKFVVQENERKLKVRYKKKERVRGKRVAKPMFCNTLGVSMRTITRWLNRSLSSPETKKRDDVETKSNDFDKKKQLRNNEKKISLRFFYQFAKARTSLLSELLF
ncbi:uncharacterized protein LOC111693209 [Anoplophora glabripennis]|uniref:uncharacterized protein LOC111693209 n=1 Tax=Anoplophora glabripennis TaxID=217634 RepID=UPI000C75A33B|nr:uncharacterized protein LOC111693209 [Anoplophora glabripennis]